MEYLAVVDVGKTNKKVLIYDARLRLVDCAYRAFTERIDGQLHLEDITAMVQWMKEQLREFSARYAVRALSISTHGATAICMGEGGELVVPPVAYTTEVDDSFSQDFYARFGTREHLQRTTATAEVGMLVNVAKKLWYIRTRWPRDFERVSSILFFPQYLGYLFTGIRAGEPTMLGCHTYLLNAATRGYSSIVDDMGIRRLLPSRIASSWDVLGTVSPAVSHETGLSTECIVTLGIHDSNASLLPYSVKGYGDFVLNSTGTWCVAMHPVDTVAFAPEEIGKMVFFNTDPFFRPVKTSVFMGGMEFETWNTLFREHFGRDDFPGYDPELYGRIANERRLFILPSVSGGQGGLFCGSPACVVADGVSTTLCAIRESGQVPAQLENYETAQAVLRLSLALQTSTALMMTGFNGEGSIFTEGGFRQNEGYNKMLAALFPRARAFCTRLEEATAFGAALLARAALDGVTPVQCAHLFEIEKQRIDDPGIGGVEAYGGEFFDRVKGNAA